MWLNKKRLTNEFGISNFIYCLRPVFAINGHPYNIGTKRFKSKSDVMTFFKNNPYIAIYDVDVEHEAAIAAQSGVEGLESSPEFYLRCVEVNEDDFRLVTDLLQQYLGLASVPDSDSELMERLLKKARIVTKKDLITTHLQNIVNTKNAFCRSILYNEDTEIYEADFTINGKTVLVKWTKTLEDDLFRLHREDFLKILTNVVWDEYYMNWEKELAEDDPEPMLNCDTLLEDDSDTDG